MAIGDYLIRVKAESGQTVPKNAVDDSEILSGGTLVDLGGGQFCWEFSGGVFSGAAPAHSLNAVAAGNGVVMAIDIEIVTYPSSNTSMVSYSPDATAFNGVHLGYGNGAGNARFRNIGSNVTQLTGLNHNRRTCVGRFRTNDPANSNLEWLEAWIDQASRADSDPDAVNSVGSNSNATTLDTLVIDASGGAVIRIHELVIWAQTDYDPSNSEAAALADDLAGALSGGSAATAVTLTGPSSGTVGVASTNFTVGANGTITGTLTVTPSDGGDGGTFSPTSVAISSGTPTATFTYTPANVGAPTATVSVTNDGGLTNPAGIDYTATAAPTGPTIDTQPSNQTAAEGAPASFSVAATTSGGTLLYQWMLDGVDITDGGAYSGATTSTLTIDPTTLAMNGDLLSVDVTDDNGTTTSSAASLTVTGSPNIRFQPGIDLESGADAASLSGLRWTVYAADYTIAHSGSGLSFNSSGQPTLDINDSDFTVGDWVLVHVFDPNTSEATPANRTVGSILGWMQAISQT